MNDADMNRCVECNTTADCASPKTCVSHSCM
jgi:hypothetical protein